MAVVSEPTQLYLRTTSLGDLLLENIEAINEVNDYDLTGHRTPFSAETWTTGTGALLPVTLSIRHRIRESTMALADAARARVLEADGDGILELIWIDRTRPTFGLVGDVRHTPILTGYNVEFELAVQDADWTEFTATPIVAWSGS